MQAYLKNVSNKQIRKEMIQQSATNQQPNGNIMRCKSRSRF